MIRSRKVLASAKGQPCAARFPGVCGGNPETTVAPELLARFLDLCMPEPNSGCWIWMGSIKPNGYGNSKVERTRAGEMAHRKSWRLHKGPVPEGLLVLHKCDVRCCVNPDHLFLGTYSDNLNDMVSKGRNKPNDLFGEDNPAAKLTAEAVSAIRSQPKRYGYFRAMARTYGVSACAIADVYYGRTWK